MVIFTERLNEAGKGIWKKLLSHPFLESVYRQEILDDAFSRWIRQNYFSIKEAVPFIALIIGHAPHDLGLKLGDSIGMLAGELEMFEKMSEEHGISLKNIRPAPTSHAYMQYLYATAGICPIEESFTVLYAAEKSFYDCWKMVKDYLQSKSKWQSFIDYWASDDFAAYIKWIESELNRMAEGLPEEKLAKMEGLYLTTARYEYMFLTMAHAGEEWPA